MTQGLRRIWPLLPLFGVAGVATAVAACSSSRASDRGPDGSLDATGDARPEGGSSTDSGVEIETEAQSDGQGPDATLDGGDGGDGGDGAEDAADAATDGCVPGPFGEPTDLRCAGLYADWDSKTVAANVHQYDPGLHLWSDGAVKTRWISLPAAPDGGVLPIDTSNMDEWTFPVGTRFFKEFVLGGKRIETRLLWKVASSGPLVWYRTTYHWASDESSAPELTDGLLDADGNGYEIPSRADCDTCHNGRLDGVLGFEAVSLASADATPYSVSILAAMGWLTDPPDASLAIPGNAVDIAALGYLHANCGTACHNAGAGEAQGTGFHMRLDVATLATVQSTDTWTTGVDQATRLFQIPGDTSTVRIAPNDAGASCVYYRMSHRDGLDDAAVGTQMPPLDTHKVDEAGVSLIAQWIGQGCQ